MELPNYVIKRISKYRPYPLYTCTLCSQTIEYEGFLINSHLKSNQHKEKMEHIEEINCKICNIQCKFLSIYKRHLKSKKHKKNTGESKESYFCKTCNIDCEFKSLYERHLNTKHHKNHDSLRTERKCDACNTTFISQKDEDRHNLTKKHIKNIQIKNETSLEQS